jgi:hypothetical protein
VTGAPTGRLDDIGLKPGGLVAAVLSFKLYGDG